MKFKRLLTALALAGATSVGMSAATLGMFNLTGDIFVNGTTSITWTDASGVANKATVSDATGIYASLNGQEVTIQTLTSATEPTTLSGFPDQLFIVFPAASGLASLNINTIFPGVDTAAACGAAPAVGQTCTPPLPSGISPFNFQNTPPAANITSTASYSAAGDVVATPNESWFANFTSQFNVPYQTVLAGLGPGTSGTVSDSYSATFTVISNVGTQTPETSTLSMFALGLGLVLLARSRGLISRLRRHQG